MSINVDDVSGCPVAQRCESCGVADDLDVVTLDTPLGVCCLTMCGGCVQAVRFPRDWPTAAALVCQHCEHLGIDLDQMAEALRAEGPAMTPAMMTAEVNALAARLAAADAEAFRSEGPRIDNRIGTLLSLMLGGLASSGVVGGLGASLSRQRHAYVAFGLLAVSAVVIVAGLVLIVRLILPRLARVTPNSGAMAQVAALPDVAAAREHDQAAGRDYLAYQAALAYHHAVAITGRFFRFRTAGRVLVAGVVLAAAGFLALAWGW